MTCHEPASLTGHPDKRVNIILIPGRTIFQRRRAQAGEYERGAGIDEEIRP